MMTYEINYRIYDTETGSFIDSDSAYTKAESLIKAQNNVAWRMVITENDDAEYPGETIEFDDGRQIIGNQKSIKNTPLYVILMQDLHANGVYVDMDYAKKLRQKFNVTHNNYAEKSEQVINFMKGIKEENTMNNTTESVVTVEEAKTISNQVLAKIIDGKTEQEKQLFRQIFDILHDHGLYADWSEDNWKVLISHGESGVLLPTHTAIDFGRAIWTEVGDEQWIDPKDAAEIRSHLVKLFKPASAQNTVVNTVTHDIYDDLASLDATLGKGNKRIQVSFSIRQHGNAVLMTRYITCLDHEARVRLNCQTKKESTDIYTGSLFQDNTTKQKIGSWKWDINWDYPILFINKKMYNCKVDKDGNPKDNVSILLLAMAEALYKNRDIKTTGKYKSAYMKSHVAVMTTDTTGLPDYYQTAPSRVENVRPARTVTGTAKIKTTPAPETNNDLPSESAFFGEAI